MSKKNGRFYKIVESAPNLTLAHPTLPNQTIPQPILPNRTSPHPYLNNIIISQKEE